MKRYKSINLAQPIIFKYVFIFNVFTLSDLERKTEVKEMRNLAKIIQGVSNGMDWGHQLFWCSTLTTKPCYIYGICLTTFPI